MVETNLFINGKSVSEKIKEIVEGFDDLVRLFSFDKIAEFCLAKMEGTESSKKHELVEFDVKVSSELELYRSIMPSSQLRLLMSDVLGQNLLSFVLRHQLSKVNVISHLGHDAISLLGIYEDDLDAFQQSFRPLQSQGTWPIVGFDPRGITWRFSAPGFCRAFDSYELKSCAELAVDHQFCQVHQSERWWVDESQPLLTQSKMFEFYFDERNIQTYGEQELRQMLNKFWQDYQGWVKGYSHEEIMSDLEAFQIPNLESLLGMGEVGLKKLFHSQALQVHPDRGGSATEFQDLRCSYLRLGAWLSLELKSSS